MKALDESILMVLFVLALKRVHFLAFFIYIFYLTKHVSEKGKD